jgi:hypothetical protein
MEPNQPTTAQQQQQPASNTSPSTLQEQELNTTATKAPLEKDENYTHNPGGYFVNLYPSHTLEQHSAAVGRDIQPYVRFVLGENFGVKDRVVYCGTGIDGDLLDLIRLDKGVERVRVEYKGGWT